MSTSLTAPASFAVTLRLAEARSIGRTRRVLALALALSIVVHLAFTLWRSDDTQLPEAIPLMATITELPPPPRPVAAPDHKPAAKPKPRRAAAATVVPPAEMPAEAPSEAREPAIASKSDAPADDASQAGAEIVPGALPEPKTLPPRIDLAYKVFWGTHGFLIGDAVYRFEHEGTRYRIATIGEARGLAALVVRGQGKIESRGLITNEGLQPLLMRVERGGPDRVETAVFDWESGIVTMHDNKTAPLDLPTFDPLALMWQYYFTPPTASEVTVTIATPRRLTRYTITREATETIEWPHGPIEAERWHRRSDDGKTDSYIWLAPTLRYIPVKIRVANTERGTIEVVLDSIRVDEDAAVVGRDDLAMPPDIDRAPPPDSPLAPPRPAETFPTMTGQ